MHPLSNLRGDTESVELNNYLLDSALKMALNNMDDYPVQARMIYIMIACEAIAYGKSVHGGESWAKMFPFSPALWSGYENSLQHGGYIYNKTHRPPKKGRSVRVVFNQSPDKLKPYCGSRGKCEENNTSHKSRNPLFTIIDNKVRQTA